MNKTIMIVTSVVLLAAIGAAIYVATACPCDRIPGVSLSGELQREPVTDWTFANEVPLCQLQVSGGVLPQSLNLNCMAGDGALYISCSRCEGKRWSSTALANPAGKIRLNDKVYPVTLQRLTAPADLDHAWAVRKAKLEGFGREVAASRPDHWWSFELSTRTP